MDGKNTYRFKREAGKHFLPGGSHLGPGDIIVAYEYEVESIIDKLDLVESGEPEDDIAPLTIRARGRGWFDVIHRDTNEPINHAALRLAEAIALAGGDEHLRIPGVEE
jgi:hypothetical protein